VICRFRDLRRLGGYNVPNFPRRLAAQNGFGRPLRLALGWQPAEDLEDLDLPATPFRQANERSGVEIKTIRGDYKDSDGANRNRLRLWEKSDFMPRPDDIFQERLYCIQWITRETLGKGRQETFFASVTEDEKCFAYGDYASLMASTTANAASLKGAADFKGQMLDGDGFAKTQLRQVLFAVWKTLEKENPKLGVTALRTEYSADYWQRRQKLIAYAEYIVAKTRHKRPEESAAAHELAEVLKLDRI
jgi:hypothetical protein